MKSAKKEERPMCGRYAASKDPATLAIEFAALDATDGRVAAWDFNVAPTKDVAAVVRRHPRDAEGNVLAEEPAVRTLRAMRWGLVPFWSKDASSGAKMINARSETAAEKPAFRKALAKRRCLVPADGWFEWRRDGKHSDPFYVTGPDSASLVFAGLWESWRDPKDREAPPLITFSVLTTDAVGGLADIHHRMPLLLTPEQWDPWLDPDSEDVTALLAPPSLDLVDTLETRPVSTRVNSVRNNGPELLERVDQEQRLDEVALFDLPS
jgi:putative SOS response-associated peptidase YedK